MSIQEALEVIRTYSQSESPAIVFLVGELGAGKTYFTNQFAKSIGIPRHLPSPTFTFLQEYSCDWEGKRKIIHCDFYRIEPDKAEKTLEQLGFWDYLEPNSILFIEWPERTEDKLLALNHKTVTISIDEKGERNYEIS